MKLTIYRYTKGEATKSITEISDFSVIGTWMDIKQVAAKINTPVKMAFNAYSENSYDYVEVSGNKYILFNEPTGTNKNDVSKYEYDLVFFGEEVLLKTALLRDVVIQGNQNLQEIRYNNGSLVEFYGGAKEFAQRMQANTDNQLGLNTWKFVVDISTEIGLTEKYFVFDALNCWEALKSFSQDTGLDFYITTPIADGTPNTVLITDKKQKVIPYLFEQGEGKGLFDISKSDSSNNEIVTRLYAQGGERNIPVGYKKQSLPVDDSRYSPFLLLPDNADGTIRYYIDDADAVSKFGIRPKIEKFDYIFPSIYDTRLKDLYPGKLVGNTFPSGTTGNDGVNIGGLSGDLRVDSIVGCDDIVENGQQFFNIYTTDLGFFLDKKSKFPDERVEVSLGDDVLNNEQGAGNYLWVFGNHIDLPKGKDITLPDFDVITPKGSAKVRVSIAPEFILDGVLLDEYEYSSSSTDVRHTVKSKVVKLETSGTYNITVSVEGIPSSIVYPIDSTISILLKGKSISYIAEGLEYYNYYTTSNAVISMRDGRYGGYDFTIQRDGTKKLTERDRFYDKGARYSIKLARLEDSGSYLPSVNAPMAPNERFVIIGIKMPDTYVTMAENRLLTASLEYMSKNNFAKAAVSMKISTGFVLDNPNIFSDFIAGNVCKVKDDGIGIEERELSISSVTAQYSRETPYATWSCTLSDVKTYGKFEQLSKEISSVGKSQKSSDLLTSESINTLYKELSEAKANFVTIDTPQTVLEKKDFRKGLNIDGISITKHPDGYMIIDGSVLFNGAATYNGTGTMDIPTITDAVNVDEVTIKKVNGMLTAVGGGGGLSQVTVKVGTTPYESVEGVVSLPAYPTVPTNYVTTNSNQDIRGEKTFYDNISLEAGKAIYSDGKQLLWAISNGNAVLNALGETLFLGYENTKKIDIGKYGVGGISVRDNGNTHTKKLFVDKQIEQEPNISLAIGDGDTGFNWLKDGQLEMKCNNVRTAYWDSDGFYFQKKVSSSYNSVDRDTWKNIFDGFYLYKYASANVALGVGDVNRILAWADVISGIGYQSYYSISSFRSTAYWGGMRLAVSNSDAGTSGHNLDLRADSIMSWSGYFTAISTSWSSDARHKTIIENIDIHLDQIADAPTIRYKWNKEGMDDKIHAGGTAQYMEEVIPETVHTGDDDFKSLDYATTAYLFAVQDARYIRELEKRVAQMEEKMERMERTIQSMNEQMQKKSIMNRIANGMNKIKIMIRKVRKGGRNGSI